MQREMKYSDDGKDVYMFVNSASGGGLGKEIIDLKRDTIQLDVPRSQRMSDLNNLVKVVVHIYNMKDQESRNRGFIELKTKVEENRPVILVICGGDGTVMWVVTELSNHKINHSKVPIAMIPLGTGNDFSQVLGWGKQAPSDLLQDNFFKLKKRVSYWLSGHQDNIDIWMVDADVYQNGKFQKVSEGATVVMPQRQIRKHWINYFSFGIDGKIGYSFDLHRTSSRMGNLAVYGMMGLVKSLTKTKKVGQLIKIFSEGKQQNAVSLESKETNEKKQFIDKQELLFPRHNTQQDLTKKPSRDSTVILQRGSRQMQSFQSNQNILALNINSFMGGIKDIWKNAKLTGQQKETDFTVPSHSDGKLQFLSFGGAMSMGMQKMNSGQGDRVHQGQGPFQIEFQAYPDDPKHRTYLQIDGQFIRFTHPRKLNIQKSTLSQTSQIRVLCRVPLQLQKNCCGCVKQHQ